MPERIRNLFNSGIAIPIREAVSSRAVYQSEEIQRVELHIQTTDGDKLILEMTPQLARKIIVEMRSAYLAINPPLTGGNNAAGWMGME